MIFSGLVSTGCMARLRRATVNSATPDRSTTMRNPGRLVDPELTIAAVSGCADRASGGLRINPKVSRLMMASGLSILSLYCRSVAAIRGGAEVLRDPMNTGLWRPKCAIVTFTTKTKSRSLDSVRRW